MDAFLCPGCGVTMPTTGDTHDLQYMGFKTGATPYLVNMEHAKDIFQIEMFKCPSCGLISIMYKGIKGQDEGVSRHVFPVASYKQFPEYVPESIRNDYKEANLILSLSPKASATLSRRCLQGMIHDFWKINEGNLAKEINKLEGKIPPDQWKVIDGVRRLGNIGAHMENDINLIVEIDPNEAHKLIRLIELLIKNWYIDQHEQQQLFSDIIEMDAAKQEQRKSKGLSAP